MLDRLLHWFGTPYVRQYGARYLGTDIETALIEYNFLIVVDGIAIMSYIARQNLTFKELIDECSQNS